jgi:hypothetical protein
MSLFTDNLIAEYSALLPSMDPYSLYNYTAFYNWWNPVANTKTNASV